MCTSEDSSTDDCLQNGKPRGLSFTLYDLYLFPACNCIMSLSIGERARISTFTSLRRVYGARAQTNGSRTGGATPVSSRNFTARFPIVRDRNGTKRNETKRNETKRNVGGPGRFDSTPIKRGIADEFHFVDFLFLNYPSTITSFASFDDSRFLDSP